MAPAPNAIFSSITPKKIRVIGVPLDLGQSRRGVDMGPSACAWPGSKRGWRPSATSSKTAATSRSPSPNRKKKAIRTPSILKEITATCTKHAELVLKTLEAGKVPLVLGGDHSVAAGTVAGVAEFYRRQNQKNRLDLD